MVRFAEEKDLPGVNKIREQVNTLHVSGRPDVFKPGFCPEMRERIYELWRSPDSDVIVAQRGGTICGMAAIEYLNKPESPYSRARKIYHVIEFGVEETHRRQGVGRELMDFIRTDAKAKGFSRIELDMWTFNETAQKFYEAVGFQTFRRLMEWDLTDET